MPAGICPKCGYPFDDHDGWLEWPQKKLKCPKSGEKTLAK